MIVMVTAVTVMLGTVKVAKVKVAKGEGGGDGDCLVMIDGCKCDAAE